MEKLFKNKVALVTGGSFGIGFETVNAFAKHGAKVVVADNLDNHRNVLKHIKAAGAEGIFVRCDVSKPAEVSKLINKCITTYGRLDIAFNNAGVEGVKGFTHECTEENWDNTMNINLKGTWLCMKMELIQMLKQGAGNIVNNASVAGLVGFAGLPAYVATKHALIGLTKTAALEYAKKNIRINAVCPGVIQTDMIDRLIDHKEENKKAFIGMEPIGRMGNPREVAEAVIWLCSDASSFVTGTALPVDGAFTAA